MINLPSKNDSGFWVNPNHIVSVYEPPQSGVEPIRVVALSDGRRALTTLTVAEINTRINAMLFRG